MGELEEGLLEWSVSLDVWKRDLLRCLAAGETISSIDVRNYANAAERIELEKAAPWFAEPEFGDAPTHIPLDSTHLTATVQGGDPVNILKIVHIHGANDLAAGACLDLNPVGLTIIAGRNGSGKSGYTRILKQVAVSRASEEVLPNAFGSTVAPKAVVSYQVGDSSARELTWEAGVERVETPLQRVRVFDTRAANVHLAGSAEIAYVPSTLQILAEYTRTLQLVEGVIDSDLQQLKLQDRQWPLLEVNLGAEIFDHIGHDKALSLLKDLTQLSQEEDEELADIPVKVRDLTASNPAALAVQAKQRAVQLTTLARQIEVISTKVSVVAIAASEKIKSELGLAEHKASEARDLMESEVRIAGTGGDAWKEMWNAARAFISADHQHEFPDTSDDSECPLCQQRLDEAARLRFSHFAAFMNGEAQTALVAARALRSVDQDALKLLPLESIITQDLVELIGTYDGEISKTVLPSIAEATSIRDALVEVIEVNLSSFDPVTLSTTLSKTIESLRDAASSENKSAQSLAETDTSALAVAQLEARRATLTVRKGLVTELDSISAQHDRTIQQSRLSTSRSSCNTSGASRKNSELSANYVEKVCRRFEQEAKELGIERVPVELIFDRSSRGVSFIKVSLKNAQQVSVSSVLSEGEQRVTAIAGFFADLTESGDASTLVFDDPVSSLDQEFRVRVAQRLLKEAESRQVLIFTHDFPFVQYLYEEKKDRDLKARARGVEPAPEINYLHIDRSGAGAGVVTTAEAWRHVSVKEQIGRIKLRIQNAKVLFRNNDLVAYEFEARDIVGAIRVTWEAFVEQDLLNGVVTRHDRSVQTRRLTMLKDLVDTDLAAVELGMTIESRYMTGHALPISDGSAPMSPDELEGEITRLEDLRKVIKNRRER